MANPIARDERSDPSRPRVLVVDDNQDAADSMELLLTSLGCEARVAYDGVAALEMARAYRPDLALIDLGLPGMDGYQVALHLRREPELQKMKLVAVTGYDWKEARLRSEAYGFDQHLVKPLDPNQLKELLATLRPHGEVAQTPPAGSTRTE
jgi:two-component system CheB/CheR fusion protein